MTGELQVETVLQLLVDQVAKLLEADAADCYLFTPERDALRCAAVHGLDPAVVGFEFTADQGLAGRAIAEGRRCARPSTAHRAAGAARRVRPFVVGGRRADGLGRARRAACSASAALDPSGEFSEADVEALATFATLASLALRNAESFEQRERQARVESGFSRIASLLGEPVSLAATLDAVAQAAAEAFGGDSQRC